jgi:hypothetical protein
MQNPPSHRRRHWFASDLQTHFRGVVRTTHEVANQGESPKGTPEVATESLLAMLQTSLFWPSTLAVLLEGYLYHRILFAHQGPHLAFFTFVVRP